MYIIYAILFCLFIKFIFAKLNNPLRPSGYVPDYIQRLMIQDLNV